MLLVCIIGLELIFYLQLNFLVELSHVQRVDPPAQAGFLDI